MSNNDLLNLTSYVKYISKRDYDLLPDKEKRDPGNIFVIADEGGCNPYIVLWNNVEISLTDDIARPKDISEGELIIPTNCKNCGALLPKIKFGYNKCVECEYCHTVYNY